MDESVSTSKDRMSGLDGEDSGKYCDAVKSNLMTMVYTDDT